MKYLDIGNDQIPQLGLGTWKSKPGEVYQAVKTALKIGYRHIDCAEIYGNEAEIGKAISESIQDGIVTRDELWITSKLWNNRHRKELIPEAIDKTLKNLQLDYLDLYLIHWPIAFSSDVIYAEKREDFVPLSTIPLSETWSGVIDEKKRGKTKHIGVSNFKIDFLHEIEQETGIKAEMNQVEMHPYLKQNQLHDYCGQKGIRMTAYAPLGSGDRPSEKLDVPVLLKNELLIDLAHNKECTPAQLLLAWAMKRETIPIPKSVNDSRLKENFKALDIELTSSEMQNINAIDSDVRYIDGSFFTGEKSPYTLEDLWG